MDDVLVENECGWFFYILEGVRKLAGEVSAWDNWIWCGKVLSRLYKDLCCIIS